MNTTMTTLSMTEMESIDGGILPWTNIALGIGIVYGVYQLGEAAGKTLYFLTH